MVSSKAEHKVWLARTRCMDDKTRAQLDLIELEIMSSLIELEHSSSTKCYMSLDLKQIVSC